ncbi:hypothetical protein NC77_17980 [Janthinobacterium lividum]|uniref:hypothetical protein n=1 Tax=Janthinobacterium lividum TaxID=29581 RepID=UPI000538B625|nr:hypothetical protein [Janthinobacterium lividum]KHA77520.1 hypothetical protein NC77_17980 [Janthinobacterium lividum]
MTIDVVATSDFIHGKLEMTKRGEASLPEQLAKDLQAAGLVMLASDASEQKVAPQVANKMAPPTRNKGAKSSKVQPFLTDSAGDTVVQAGTSADVCTDKPGDLAEGAATAANAVQLSPDVAPGGSAAGGEVVVGPPGSAAVDAAA